MLGELLRLAGQLHAGHRLGEGDKARLAGLERATAGQGVGLVGYLASVDGLTMQAIALVVVDRDPRRVDGDFMEVRPTQARQLGVLIGVDAPRQQRIVGEIDPRDHMGGAEGHLLGLGKEVVRVAVEHQPADRRYRHQLLRNDLGRIQQIEAEFSRILLGDQLHAEGPLRVFPGINRLPQVAAMEVRIGTGNLHRLIPHQRMGAQLGGEVEFDEGGLALPGHEAEGVHAKALHHAVAARNGPVGHLPHQHAKKPWAPEPRACTMRSGMRSWSKWVIFSRRMKSLSSAGPRTPALSEDWLSAISTPWLVVSGPMGVSLTGPPW